LYISEQIGFSVSGWNHQFARQTTHRHILQPINKSVNPYTNQSVYAVISQWINSSIARLTVQRNDDFVSQPKIQSRLRRNALQNRAWRASPKLSCYQLDINLTFEVLGNTDLCNRKMIQGATDTSVKTENWAEEATNPSARRITYARRSIARCLLSYSKGFGLPAKLPSCPCRGLGSDSEVVIP